MNNIEVLSINSLNWKDYKKNLEEMCKLSEKDNSIASKNVNWKDWQNNKSSLMYSIVKKKRFDKGKFFLCFGLLSITIISTIDVLLVYKLIKS